MGDTLLGKWGYQAHVRWNLLNWNSCNQGFPPNNFTIDINNIKRLIIILYLNCLFYGKHNSNPDYITVDEGKKRTYVRSNSRGKGHTWWWSPRTHWGSGPHAKAIIRSWSWWHVPARRRVRWRHHCIPAWRHHTTDSHRGALQICKLEYNKAQKSRISDRYVASLVRLLASNIFLPGCWA